MLIRWEGVSASAEVNLEYSTDNGGSWNAIAAAASGLQYKWKVPDFPSERCLIQITQKSGAQILDGYPYRVADAVYSHDERLVISIGSIGGESVIARDVNSGDIRWQIDSSIWMKPNPVHNTLVIVDARGTGTLRNSETGAYIDSLREQQGKMNNARFSPDGALLLSGGGDGKVMVWDGITGKHLRTLTGHVSSVPLIRFSHNGLRVVAAGSDATLRVWDVHSGQLLRTIKGTGLRFWSAGLSPDGSKVIGVILSDTVAKVWDVATGAELLSLPGDRFVSFSPDGARIVVGNDDQGALMYDAATGALLHTLGRHEDDFHSAVYSPDGTRLVTLSRDGVVNLWNAESAQFEKSITGNWYDAASAIFSKNGKRLLTSNPGKTVRIWDLDNIQQTTDLSDAPFTIWPTTLAVPQVDLGTTPYGLSRDSTVTAVIRNPDSKPLRVENFRITGTDSMSFSLLPNLSPIDIPAGGTADLTFRFTPSAGRQHEATLEMQAHESVLRLPLRGEGLVLPVIPQTPLIDFGQVTVGTIKDTVVGVIRNMTDRSIRIDTVRSSGVFSVGYGIKGTQVGAGEILQVKLFFNAAGVFKDRRPLLVVYQEENRGLDTVRLEVQGEGVKPASVDKEDVGIRELSVYPNPAGDRVDVAVKLEKAGTVRVLLHDLAGRTVYEEERGVIPEGTQRFDVDVSGVPAGTYLLVVETSSGRMSSGLQIVR